MAKNVNRCGKIRAVKIEIDQSGKIENTNRPTVIASSSGKSLIIFPKEKQIVQKYFRKINRGRQFIYWTFAALILILLYNDRIPSDITIDREYPGQEALIKSYLMQLLRFRNHLIDKRLIVFHSVGKKSKAHLFAYQAYQNRKATILVKAQEILKLMKT